MHLHQDTIWNISKLRYAKYDCFNYNKERQNYRLIKKLASEYKILMQAQIYIYEHNLISLH